MVKKGLLFLLVLLLMGGAAYFLLQQDNSSTLNAERSFGVEDASLVNAVNITGKEGRKIELKRHEDGPDWTVNGRYVARKDAIETMLSTLERMRIDYPIPAGAKPSVMKRMKEQPKIVELFLDDGSTKTIRMAGNPPEKIGTYAMIEGEEDAFVIHIPRFQGFLDIRFFAELQDWRSRMAFDFSKNEINEVTVAYPGDSRSSFKIVNKPGGAVMLDLHDHPVEAADQSRVDEYLSYFEFLPVEAWENYYVRKDSLLVTRPFSTITVKGKSNEQTMKVYPFPVNQRSKTQFDKEGKPLEFDLDRYFAVLNKENDLAIIQVNTFQKVMLGRQQFISEKK